MRQFIALFVIAAVLVVGGSIFYYVKTHRAYTVPSSGMEPTILQGEGIIVGPYSYDNSGPQRGAVVVIQHGPENLFMVKRVIAISGDTIEAHQAHVFVNGREISEPYIQHLNRNSTVPFMNDFGPIKVGKGSLFVMGDNRDVAYDSRQPAFGLVPTSELRGKVLSIGSSAVFGRIGKKVH